MIFTELSHAHITFVIGLPGSGKSYLLNYLKENPFIEPDLIKQKDEKFKISYEK